MSGDCIGTGCKRESLQARVNELEAKLSYILENTPEVVAAHKQACRKAWKGMMYETTVTKAEYDALFEFVWLGWKAGVNCALAKGE